MADVKDNLSAALVERLADQLAAAGPGFDRARFAHLATAGLAKRELKARIDLIADALVATMPRSLHAAATMIRTALRAGGINEWASLPVNEYITSAMLDRPDVALPLFAELTPRFSAEFAIRPFIDAHYDLVMRQLHEWAADPDEHVRRLVSEGTRPRLPWAPVLRRFVADPSPTIALLDRLHDDDAEYVRRSVANHLNDISKDHPDLAVATASRWSRAATHGDFVVRHALRTLVKRGDHAALALLGFDHDVAIEVVEFTCSHASVQIGDGVTIAATLRAPSATRAAIDYLVHYQGANGPKAPKVFKLAVRDLPTGTAITVTRRHRFEHVSVLRIHPGVHRLEIQVNGRVLAAVEVDVFDGDAPTERDTPLDVGSGRLG